MGQDIKNLYGFGGLTGDHDRSMDMSEPQDTFEETFKEVFREVDFNISFSLSLCVSMNVIRSAVRTVRKDVLTRCSHGNVSSFLRFYFVLNYH